MGRAHLRAPSSPTAARLVLAALVGVYAMTGCSRSGAPGGESSPVAATPTDASGEVVATIGNRAVTATETDALVAAQLQDLDYRRYLLRRQAVEALVLRELAAPGATVRTASIKLMPPLPAAVELPGSAAGYRPATAAPVTVSVFCDFESPHCAAAQGTLGDLLSLYPRRVRIAARDLPLPMHPLAAAAAEAARCAGRQGRYWEFHDLLRARGRTPDRPELDQVARAAGLDREAFGDCIDERAEAGAVAADAALAQRLGLGMVPAVFVNGRAVPPPASPDRLVWLVEEELRRTGAGGGEQVAPEPTGLPLTLRATIVGDLPGLGLALVGGSQPGAPATVCREGERVTPDAILRRVRADHVELLVDGRVETLSFATAAAAPEPPGEAAADRAAPEAPAPVSAPRTSAMPVYLDRELVRERMADRVALSTQLKPVTMTVDGYRLLQLTEVAPGSLYELLGLQPGDVIVMVNEQAIHEGDNPLWDALDRDQEVRVRVMRRGGMAQHYTYRFE